MARPKKEVVPEGEFEVIETIPRNMEIGETIVGTFVGTRPGKYGDIFMLDSEKGERYNIFGGIQFDSILTPDKIGRTFRIKHISKERTSRGYWVRTYKIELKREKVE